MFGKLFSNNAAKAKAEYKKLENRNLMEAICAGCLLIAKADGEIEKAESETIEKLLRANPSMAHFGNDISETITRFTELLSAGGALARVKLMREIEDIKNVPAEAEEAFACMVDTATSDGEIEPAEKVVLGEIARKLNLRLSDFGIEA